MTLDLSSLFHATIGFDDLGRILNNFASAEQSNTYPPYNITKINHDSYKVSIALAGFEAKDISIILEKDILTIKSEVKFKITKLGVDLYKYFAASEEIYKTNEFFKFSSKTNQNKNSTVDAWKALSKNYFDASTEVNGMKIPILWGTDAVHGHNNVIGATIFPPLDRTISDFIKSKNNFYSYIDKNNLLGVIEIDCKADSVHIQSLVVSPNHFRKGIASKLIDKVFTLHKSLLYTVETGNDNDPAKKLYESKVISQIMRITKCPLCRTYGVYLFQSY